jgi:D-arabinose 1-dehydrogenase-like Zn-dependent alcohol dehydrogenase
MVNIPKTSRAAVVTAFGKPLEIRDVPIPGEIEPGAILVRTDRASICGSDVHLWEGAMVGRRPIKLPVILGHEMAGRVVRLGAGAERDSVGQALGEGDRIIWTHASCGQCYYCRVTYQPTLCMQRRYYMFSCCEEFPYLLGGFSEYCYVMPTSGRVRIPDGISSELASAASCALRTVVHGFDRLGRLTDLDTVAIQGAGPLGLFSLAAAIRAGAGRTILIGAPAKRLDVARRWGADHVLNIDEARDAQQRLERILDLTDGLGPDVVIEVSGGATAFPEGLEMIRRGGRYLVIGQVSGAAVSMKPSVFTQKHIQVIGVLSGAVEHYYKALAFLAANRDRFAFEEMLSNRYRLDQINQALTAMQRFEEVKPVVLPEVG